MSTERDMRYMDSLEEIALEGVQLIREKTATYGDSWKRRGGQGAWFTTVRPWDRLEGIVARHQGDVITAVMDDPTGADGSALACVRDLRNYLLLIEAHASVMTMDQGSKVRFVLPETTTPEVGEKWTLTRAVEQAQENAPAHELQRRIRMLRDTHGYTVYSCSVRPGHVGWSFVVPGHVPGSANDPDHWPHSTAEEAWQAAWEHLASTLDEGTRAGAAPAQPLEDAGDPSAAPPATVAAAVTSQGPHASQRRTRAPTDEQVAALVEHANLLGLDVQVTHSFQEKTILTLPKNEAVKPASPREQSIASGGRVLQLRLEDAFRQAGYSDVAWMVSPPKGGTMRHEFIIQATYRP